ncbi:hypothetical protein QBC34DRAFT_213546 [Podospora aff. communis PSN243]|uniref:MARVEL domain-containing protein n=1 Tax=Podospora aff. communis PSN243 TaxID=3040156 RepID=A0AAV9G236_9PEZI|nr:hypothetical protein QBC34DRAFT_213546 [Podospora aff. communis PSN243]
MARARLPGRFAIILTILHAISLVACVLTIGAAAYSAAAIKKQAVATIGAFVAAFWTIGVDIAEVAALADKARKRIRRCSTRYLWLLELTTAVFCFGLPAASSLGYDAVEYERCRFVRINDRKEMGCELSPGPLEAAQAAWMGGIYLAATIHSILFVMTTVQCCVARRKAKKYGGREKGKPGLSQHGPEGVLAPPPRAVVRD